MGKLLTWIIKSDQPFSMVDNIHFADLLEYLKKDIVIVSRSTLMRRLDELYLLMKGQLKQKLHSFKSKYSITCDIWTSKNQLSFFGFTIHYIDDDWRMKDGLLAFKYLKGEHDGLSLAKEMIEILEEFEIADRLLGVTADNASNNSTMMACLQAYYNSKYPNSGFSKDWNQIECMAHVLNLGAQQILKSFKVSVDKETYEATSDSSDKMVSAVSRLAFLVRKIRKSPKLKRIFEKVCEEKKIKYLVPIIDVSTRWNSTYDMLLRALEYKDVISTTFYRHEDNSFIKLLLTKEEWNTINQLIEVLKPLKDATLLASQNSDSLMITNVIPLFNFCVDMLTGINSKFEPTDDIHIGISAAIEKMTHYYDKISPIAGVALILNPTMKQGYLKDILLWKDEWVDSVMQCFHSSYVFYKEKNGNVNVTASGNAPMTTTSSTSTERGSQDYKEYLNELKRKRGVVVSKSVEEYIRYFNSPELEAGSNVMDFWKANLPNYPILAAMAKDYLTVQASSVSAERAFSSGTDLVTSDRCSLSGEVIEKTQFLKYSL
jgi:hypothetical protein